MENRVRPTRSGLFAIELMVAVGVFALAAAIAIGLFVRSEVISRRSADLTRAVSEASSAAECFKAAGGDMKETASLLGTFAVGDAVTISYDGSWERCPDMFSARASLEKEVFRLTLTAEEKDGYTEARLLVTELESGDELVSWTVAALEVTP